jgi:fatty acid desaturase
LNATKNETCNATSSQSAEPVSAERMHLDHRVVEELRHVSHVHYVRLGIFLGLYLAASCGAFWMAHAAGDAAWVYVANLPLYILAAASLHGISLFTHEGVHGTLSLRSWWNRALSIICALPVLQNYSAYKVLHLKHHHHLGQEGDPDHYANYTSWTWLEFAMHWGRLIIGYPAYIVAIPLLGFRQGARSARGWIVLEVCLLAMLIAAAVLLLPNLWLLHGWLLPMVVINTLVNIRGMSQHTFLEHQSDTIRGTRSILTNRVTAFFMCNENYHLEHHLYPTIPWYNLPRLHQALRGELVARGAPYIKSYFAFVCEFVSKSLRRSPLGRADQRG